MVDKAFLREAIAETKKLVRRKSLEAIHVEHGIKAKSDGNHVILDYGLLTNVNWDEPYAHVCRGLVLDAHTQDVLCFGLPKFWNIQEVRAAKIDWEYSRVAEKLDGSMVNVWWSPHEESCVYSTRYQLPRDMKANKLPTGRTWWDLAHEALPTTTHESGKITLEYGGYPNWDSSTYTFEVMAPDNRVVVRHNAVKSKLIAARCRDTLQEHFWPVSSDERGPRVFELRNADAVKEFAETLDGTEQEGFVVIDMHYNRVKVKGSSYVRLHHLRDGLNSFKNLVLAVHNGEISEVLAHFPEFKDQLEKIDIYATHLLETHEQAYEELKDIESQKEFALGVQAKKLPAQGLLFSVRAGKYKNVAEAYRDMREAALLRLFESMKP